VGVNKGTKETFGVISGACQLFNEVRFAACISAEGRRVGSYAGDANAVWSPIPRLKYSDLSTGRAIAVVGDVG
jgi:hypothetical protein